MGGTTFQTGLTLADDHNTVKSIDLSDTPLVARKVRVNAVYHSSYHPCMRVDIDISPVSIIPKKKTGIQLRCQDLTDVTNFYHLTSLDSTDTSVNSYYSDSQLICGFNFLS